MVFALMMGSLTVFRESLASVRSVVGDRAIPPAGNGSLRSRSASRVARVKLPPAESPATKIDPTTRGWKKIAFVDTRPDRNRGGQYGVSITDPTGSLGHYRYLLFDVFETESDDVYGNTFFSEIDVTERK